MDALEVALSRESWARSGESVNPTTLHSQLSTTKTSLKFTKLNTTYNEPSHNNTQQSA
jgi:hypothetical protein